MRRLPLAAVGLTAAGWAAPALAPIVPAVGGALRIPRRLADLESVALTFDDGPHPQGTPEVLARLDGAGTRATFFLVGEQVNRYPSIAAEIAARGHAVALHGQRHRSQLRLRPGQVRDDIERGAETIATATGVEPLVYDRHTGSSVRPVLRRRAGAGCDPCSGRVGAMTGGVGSARRKSPLSSPPS